MCTLENNSNNTVVMVVKHTCIWGNIQNYIDIFNCDAQIFVVEELVGSKTHRVLEQIAVQFDCPCCSSNPAGPPWRAFTLYSMCNSFI